MSFKTTMKTLLIVVLLTLLLIGSICVEFIYDITVTDYNLTLGETIVLSLMFIVLLLIDIVYCVFVSNELIKLFKNDE